MKKIITILCLSLLINFIIADSSIRPIAENSHDPYLPFFATICKEAEFQYSLDKVDQLYDGEDNYFADQAIVTINGENYYAVFNRRTGEIEEYGEYSNKVERKEQKFAKKYYHPNWGVYKVNGNSIHSSRNNLSIERDAIPVVKKYNYKGYGKGLMSYPEMRTEYMQWMRTKTQYLSGVSDWNFAEDLKFVDMDAFSGYSNHCGPTALTNILIYYQWLGKKVLFHDSVRDTFEKIRKLVLHSNKSGTFLLNMSPGIGAYLNDYTNIKSWNHDVEVGIYWETFQKGIDQGYPEYIMLNIPDVGNHFVVALGYDEFRNTGTAVHHYMRIVTGWNDSNDSIYLNMNNYYGQMSVGIVKIS